jgi:hypothetical protein
MPDSSYLYLLSMKRLTLLFIWLVCMTSVRAQSAGEVPGQLMVQLVPHATLTQLLSNLQQQGFQVEELETLSQRLRIHLLAFDPVTTNAKALLAVCQQQPGVAIAQFNHYVQFRSYFPDDPFFYLQWNFFNDGSTGGVDDADTDAELAWDLNTGGWTIQGDTIVVAVVDDGFHLDHNDLVFRKNYQEIPGNATDDDDNGFVDDFDGWNSLNNTDDLPDYSHGTHVSGIVGARGDNLYGVTGVNWNVQILPVSIGTGSVVESNVVESYGYIFAVRELYNLSGGTKGSFIVATNASFGIDDANPDDYPLWCAMYDSLGSLGILNAGATANSNVDVDVVGDMPTACSSDFLITVNSFNKTNTKSSSGFGATTIDLAAPGSLVYSTVTDDGFNYQSGTSMASPHVAGTVALMLADACENFFELYLYQPEVAASLLKQFILDGTDTLAELDGITVTGGKLNIYNAMVNLQNYCDTMTAGVAEMNRSVRVYPNPASEQLFLQTPGTGNYTFSFTDIMGRNVLQGELHMAQIQTIDISSLTPGMYVVTLLEQDSQVPMFTRVIIE